MIEVKSLNGKMNLDDNLFRLPKEDYTDALNITKDAVEGSNDSVVSNIVSNRLVGNLFLAKTYTNPTYNIVCRVTNNNDGTMTMYFTFDVGSLPVGVTAINITYNDGTDHNYAGAATSPRQATIPSGNYSYSLTVNFASSHVTYPLTQTEGENICIGAYANTLRNTVVFMEWNKDDYHSVLEYDNTTRTISPILLNLIATGGVDILGFTEHNKITSINIYNRDEGDLLEFIDSVGRPTYMDITIMKSGTYTPVTRDLIDLALVSPASPPQGIYANDTTVAVNYTRGKFYRFAQTFVEDTNRESTFSPFSEVLLPIKLLDPVYTSVQTNNNVINVSFNSGGKNIKKVNIYVTYVDKTNNWSDWLLVESIDKAKKSISDNTIFNYAFYNDSTYPSIDPKFSGLLFDYIDICKASELANGNVNLLAAITEGYDNDLIPNVVNTVTVYPITSPISGNLTQVTVYEGDNFFTYQARTIFSGVPAVGTTIEFKVKQAPGGAYVTAAFYTTLNGDTTANVVNGLIASFATYGNIYQVTSFDSTRVTYEWQKILYFKDITETITAPTSALSTNSIPVFKWSSQRNYGIAYFDKKGKTNGIIYNAKITFPAYSEDAIAFAVNLPKLNVKIYHRPPIWAYSFQFLFTKDDTQFLFWATKGVNKDETDYLYFDVTNFDTNAAKFPTTATVLSYSFKDGDRMRLIKELGTTTYRDDTFDAAIIGLVVEPKINGVVQTGKKFIKIKKTAPFSDVTITAQNYEIEIYRPVQTTANAENRPYFECGRQYPVLNPTTADRVHAGEVTDQSINLATPAEFNFTKGSSYYRQRIIALNDITTILFNLQDNNIIDDYISAVNSIDGRPNLIDTNARRAKFGAIVRFGQAYQANTNINGLNRFYPEDFIEVDYSFGDIERLKTRERFVRVFQQYKIGKLPLFSEIRKNATGGNIQVVTDKLLNPVGYYNGNVGIGTAPESLSSNNYADYGVDNYNGNIWRVSEDGVDIISLIYNINSLATEQLVTRVGNFKCYGVFDRLLNNYVLALEATNTQPAVTITFDENNHQDKKGFESFLSLHPEMMVVLGTLNIQYKNGNLYTQDDLPHYNNFFGVQYDSTITPCFNQNELQKKTFIAITELASRVWDCPEIITSSNEYGIVKQTSELIEQDFEELESDFCASFLRASNSIGGLIDGSSLKGNLCVVKMRAKMLPPPNNLLVTLAMLSLKSIDSPLNVIK